VTHVKKPVVRVVHCAEAPHGVKPELVVTIHPNGILVMRPTRQRTAPVVQVPLARLYAKYCGRLDF
jgi:hypothetical protein